MKRIVTLLAISAALSFASEVAAKDVVWQKLTEVAAGEGDLYVIERERTHTTIKLNFEGSAGKQVAAPGFHDKYRLLDQTNQVLWRKEHRFLQEMAPLVRSRLKLFDVVQVGRFVGVLYSLGGDIRFDLISSDANKNVSQPAKSWHIQSQSESNPVYQGQIVPADTFDKESLVVFLSTRRVEGQTVFFVTSGDKFEKIDVDPIVVPKDNQARPPQD